MSERQKAPARAPFSCANVKLVAHTVTNLALAARSNDGGRPKRGGLRSCLEFSAGDQPTGVFMSVVIWAAVSAVL